jgi:fatty-acyl-CoA synthase
MRSEGTARARTLAGVIDGPPDDAPAIVFRPLAGGRRVVTFGELRTSATAAAARLGDARGRRIGILAPNRPEWLAAAFGIWRAGGVLVALNTWWRREELAHALRLAAVDTLLIQERFLDHDYAADVTALGPELPALRDVRRLDDIAAGSLRADAVSVHETEPAVVLFTSGTTAAARAVLHRHEALVRSSWNISARQLIDASDVVWMNFPLFFSAGLVNASLGALCRGASLVFQERFEATGALEAIETERCTVFQTWPTAIRELARHPRFAEADLSSLRKGTGPLDLGGPLKRDGGSGVGMYGMTETATACTCTWGDDAPEVRARSQGAPFQGTEIRICDSQTGATLGAGEEGEIRVRGYGVMEGYIGVPRSECFDADGFLRTGDRGILDRDGRLRYLGRLGDTIKIQGVNVSPAEVESVLARHADVREVAVLGLPDLADRSSELIYAAVVLRDGAALDADALREHCRRHAAAYKVPAIVEAVDELPYDTTGGKVQKFKLREAALRQRAR